MTINSAAHLSLSNPSIVNPTLEKDTLDLTDKAEISSENNSKINPIQGEHLLTDLIRGNYVDLETMRNIVIASDSIHKHILENKKALLRSFVSYDALDLLEGNPAGRKDCCRLTSEQQANFIKLILKREDNRTSEDLYKAGVLIKDLADDEIKHFEYIKSDKFLKNWFKTGYFNVEIPKFTWSIINLDYTIICAGDLSDNNFIDSRMRYAHLCRTKFYKCNFIDANLTGATAFRNRFVDCICNGYVDMHGEKLKKCGLEILSEEEPFSRKYILENKEILLRSFFGHGALELLEGNPAGRKDCCRLTSEQQDNFVNLIFKYEEDRTSEDLYKAGVLIKDLADDEIKHFEYIKSDKFLKSWFKTGYFNIEIPKFTWSLINLEYANISNSYLHNGNFIECEMSHAKLDGSNFYECQFTDANLTGATAFGSHFKRCNGHRYDWALIEEFKKCGLEIKKSSEH